LYHLPGGQLPYGSTEREAEDDDESVALTIQVIFGDEKDPENEGMNIDDLIDAIHGRLVYFLVYACTSFAVSNLGRLL